jgi:hypothetical protein
MLHSSAAPNPSGLLLLADVAGRRNEARATSTARRRGGVEHCATCRQPPLSSPPGCRASTGGGAGTAAGELDPRRRRRLGRGEALALGGEASSGSLNEDGDGRYSPIVWVVAESAPFLHRYRSEQKMDHRYEASVGG